MARGSLKFQVSTCDPCLYFVFWKKGRAVGAIATPIDGNLGCGESDVSSKTLVFSGRRFGALRVEDKSVEHVGMTVSQEQDFSVKSTQEKFTKSLKPIPISPALLASRRRSLSSDEIKLRQ